MRIILRIFDNFFGSLWKLKTVFQEIVSAYFHLLIKGKQSSSHISFYTAQNISFQFPADLVTFTKETLDGKLHFLCSATPISSLDKHLGIYFDLLTLFRTAYSVFHNS